MEPSAEMTRIGLITYQTCSTDWSSRNTRLSWKQWTQRWKYSIWENTWPISRRRGEIASGSECLKTDLILAFCNTAVSQPCRSWASSLGRPASSVWCCWGTRGQSWLKASVTYWITSRERCWRRGQSKIYKTCFCEETVAQGRHCCYVKHLKSL